MKELSEKAIAAWHREQAAKYYGKYLMHKEVADSMSAPASGAFPSRLLDRGDGLRPATVSPAIQITVEQLNAALRIKRGRVANVAQRLNTVPVIVDEVLRHPESEFGVGERGFIYSKAELEKQAEERKKNKKTP